MRIYIPRTMITLTKFDRKKKPAMHFSCAKLRISDDGLLATGHFAPGVTAEQLKGKVDKWTDSWGVREWIGYATGLKEFGLMSVDEWGKFVGWIQEV